MKGFVRTIVLMGLVLFSSCEHKELCYIHDQHALKREILLQPQWQQYWEIGHGYADWQGQWPAWVPVTYNSLLPGIPEGLRVITVSDTGSRQSFNLSVEGGVVSLGEGFHSLLCYNNDTEYIVFDDLSSSASTRSRSRGSYMGNSYSKGGAEHTVNAPDVLYGAFIPEVEAGKSQYPQPLEAVLRPLVYTYVVRYEFSHGSRYVALARGALAGMAESVNIPTGSTSENAVTVLYDCSVNSEGCLAYVNSFGIPSGVGERTFALNLEVMLYNGKVKTFEFDVTAQVAAQPQGGVIVVDGIEIPDAEGLEGGSGFKVDVDGWGDYEDVELDF